jgi:hypothetical protein
VRATIDAEDLMTEAEIEHDTIKQLIERVQAGEVDRDTADGDDQGDERVRGSPRQRRAAQDFPASAPRRTGSRCDWAGNCTERKMELESELQDATIDQSDEVDERLQGGGRKGSRGGMAARDSAPDEE